MIIPADITAPTMLELLLLLGIVLLRVIITSNGVSMMNMPVPIRTLIQEQKILGLIVRELHVHPQVFSYIM